MHSDEISEILNRIDCFSNLSDCTSQTLKKKLACAFTFEDTINGVRTNITIGIDSSFPLSLPLYFISDYDNYEFIPHVERDGRICYTHDDYVYLNTENPEYIIRETYQLAKTTIEKGLRKENFEDFANEFESYWSRIDGCEEILGNVIIENEPKQIKIGTKEKLKIAVTDTQECLESISRFIQLKDKGITYSNGLLIPFKTTSIFIPPKYNQQITIEYIHSLLNLLEPKSKKALNKLLPSNSKKEEYVLFSFGQTNGNNCVFGFKFSNIKSKGYPLATTNFEGKIIPIHLERIDKETLYKRGGNSTKASEKKGLLIGGGSIGGFIAEELVRNGYFNLTVVDGDSLSSANCYRHLTGFSKRGKNKALAIKEKIEFYYPHSSISAIETGIEKAIAKKAVDFKNYDFVVVSTGNVTVNMYLNKIFYHQYERKPLFYCWNEPYGIGGHCLVTNIEKGSCYNCLYSNEDIYNEASFAHLQQNKTFLKSISGCGSTYTPYGSIDSMQTCILTVKKVIDVMNSTSEINGIYSWKGNPSLFLQEGFKLSDRFVMSENELKERINNYASPNCKICKP